MVSVFLPQCWRNTEGINLNKLYLFTFKPPPPTFFVALFFCSVFFKTGDNGLKRLCRLILTLQNFYCHPNSAGAE